MKKIIMVFLLCFAFVVNAEGEATINNIKVNGKDATCTGYDCTVEVDSDKVIVTYSLIDSNATVDRASGFSIDLTSPTSLVKIVVKNDKNEDVIENTYNITINKHEKSGDYTLSSLKVNDEDITLLDEVFVYNYTSKYDDEKIVIAAKPKDSRAKIVSELTFDFPLDRSSLALDFDVKAENEEVKTYRVVVSRGVKPNTYLKTLKIDKIDLKFDKEKTSYEEKVEYSINELMVEATAEKEEAKVVIDKPEKLEVGENLIKIKVTLEKAETVYEIKVTREPNLDKSLANLKSLKVKEYDKLDFEPNVLEYNLKFREIPNTLTIEAKAVDSNGKIEIKDNEDLKDGDIVIVKVSLPADEYIIEREYSLKIIESKSIVSNKMGILISMIVLIIVIIILLIIEIKERKKNKKKLLTKIKALRKKKEKLKEKNKKEEKEEEIEII